MTIEETMQQSNAAHTRRAKIIYDLYYDLRMGKMNNKDKSALYGYVLAKLFTITENKDGTISFPPFWDKTNKLQYEAESIIESVVDRYNEQLKNERKLK